MSNMWMLVSSEHRPWLEQKSMYDTWPILNWVSIMPTVFWCALSTSISVGTYPSNPNCLNEEITCQFHQVELATMVHDLGYYWVLPELVDEVGDLSAEDEFFFRGRVSIDLVGNDPIAVGLQRSQHTSSKCVCGMCTHPITQCLTVNPNLLYCQNNCLGWVHQIHVKCKSSSDKSTAPLVKSHFDVWFSSVWLW